MKLWKYKAEVLLPHRLIVLLLFLVSLFFTDIAYCYTLSIGHFSPSSNTFTSLVITDLSGLGPSVDISFHEDSGRLVSTSSKLLPPNGKIRLPVETYLRKAGNIIVNSHSEDIVGEYWQFYENGSVIVIPLQSSTEEKQHFVNGFRFHTCSSGLLVISDPYGSGPTVQMEFYDRAGNLVNTVSNKLRPYGVLISELSNYIHWHDLGKVSVKSLRGSIVLHCRYLCGNNNISAFPARFPAHELLISDFSAFKTAKGRSILVITDISGRGPNNRIQFISKQGISKLNKLLPPNGSIIIDISDYVDNVEKGVIQINSSAEVVADYWERNQQGVLNNRAIGNFGNNLLISCFSPSKNVQNLLSLLNFGQVSVKVELQFYNDEGKKLGSKGIVLKPYKHYEEPIDRYFGNMNLGTVIIKCPNNNVLASSKILSLEDNRLMGKVYAQMVR